MHGYILQALLLEDTTSMNKSGIPSFSYMATQAEFLVTAKNMYMTGTLESSVFPEHPVGRIHGIMYRMLCWSGFRSYDLGFIDYMYTDIHTYANKL